jgi:hypothetical protein
MRVVHLSVCLARNTRDIGHDKLRCSGGYLAKEKENKLIRILNWHGKTEEKPLTWQREPKLNLQRALNVWKKKLAKGHSERFSE